MSAPAFRIRELAARFGLELRGDGEAMIRGVATLAKATPDQLSFLANPHYRAQLANSAAGCVVLRAEDAAAWHGACLVTPDPYLAYAKIAALFERQPTVAPGVHPSAVVAPSARIAPSASIGPLCVVEAGATIEDGAVLGPLCTIGPDCVVGAQSRLVARVTLVTRVTLGRRVLVHPGAVLGADGFGLAFDREHWIKVPQLGGVCIGDDCEIGANTTIDRGALEDTVLEQDVRLDNQIQIAHNVVIGAHTALAGCAAVAGSTIIGRYCRIGGGAGILGHLRIADHVTIAARSLITHSIPTAGEYASGVPFQSRREWRRNAARFKQLDEIARRLHAIEKERKP
jgi:UDP-3-O-[3-hydroxymyristoyl] glucosamine N-acyltransferase